MRVRGDVVKAHLSSPKYILKLSEAPSFNSLLSPAVLPAMSPEHTAYSVAFEVFPEYTSTSPAYGSGLRHHSLPLRHDTNSAQSFLACWTVCVSVFLGRGSRQDEDNTKPLGIGKIVPGMPGIPSGNLDV